MKLPVTAWLQAEAKRRPPLKSNHQHNACETLIMSRDLFIVDAFSEVPFKGNPAAVVLLRSDDEISDIVLQAIAAELNLSETAFVRPISGGAASGDYGLRWFTPTNEVPLCGHATMASAHALFSHPVLGTSLPRMLRFSTLSGQLTVERLLDGDLCMVLPLHIPVACGQSTYVTQPSSNFAFIIVFLVDVASITLMHVFLFQICADCFNSFLWTSCCRHFAFSER